jgi:hypothetical protein
MKAGPGTRTPTSLLVEGVLPEHSPRLSYQPPPQSDDPHEDDPQSDEL